MKRYDPSCCDAWSYNWEMKLWWEWLVLDCTDETLYFIVYAIYLTLLFLIAQGFILLRPRLQLQCIRDPLLMNIDFLVIFWRKICFLLYIFIKWKQILIVFQNLELKFSWCWQICLFFDWLRPRLINKYLVEVHSEITSTFTLTLKNESG